VRSVTLVPHSAQLTKRIVPCRPFAPLDAAQLLDDITQIMQDEVAYVPLYSQPILWGVRDGVSVTPRSDNFFILRWVSVDE